jgi:hypothetical protein
MTTIQEIEKAVSALPSNELEQFRKWFDEFDAKEWDKQFENDVMSGKLDQIAENAIADFDKGKFKEL